MWVSGKVQTTSSIPQMLNDLDTLHGSGLTVYPLDTAYALIDTSYINNHLFFCETKGSIHYFVSSDRINASTIINSPGCEKTMTAIAITKTAGGKNMFDAYPYEYRPPLLGADSIIVQVPTGYFLSSASLKNRILFNSFEYNSDTIGIPLTDSLTGTVVFVLSDLPSLNCLTQADTPSVANQTMWYGDQLNYRIIDMKLMPLTCDVAPVIAPDTTIKIRFDRENIPCMTTAGCALAGAVPIKQNGYNPVTLFISPGLNRTDTATTALAIKDTVCWDIAMNNFAGLSQADHVFIAILPDGVQNVLSGWHFYPTDSTVANYLNDTIVPITIALGHDSIITGKLCAVVNVCDTVITIPINIHYGWNCGEWPQLPYDSTAVCGYYLDSLAVDFADVKLVSEHGKTYESPYTLCDTITLNTCFQNIQQGFLFPFEVVVTPLDSGLHILSGTMYNSNTTAGLIPTASDTLWQLHPDSLLLLYPQGGFNNAGPELCISFQVLLDCAYAGDTILPDKELFARSYCGDTVSFKANYSNLGAFVWNETSKCDACFTLSKTAEDSVAYTGTPITYNITACNYSADTNTVNIVDLFPLGFTTSDSTNFFVTLQSMECDTFAVTGTFGAADSCPHSTNIAMLIHNSDTLLMDSVCIPVISTTALCIAQADTIWSGTLYSTSLPKTFSSQIIFIADSLIVNDTLEFFNSHLIIGGGGSITVVDSGYLYSSATLIEACDSMWQGIYANERSRVMISERSEISDANVAVMARNKSFVTVIDSKLSNNARNVVIPVMTGISTNSVILTMHGDTILMDTTAYKPSYPGQPSHAFRPLSGVEAHHWVGTIGSSGDDKRNVFMNLIAGIATERSLIRVENNEFKDMYKDTTGLFNTSLHGIGVVAFSTVSQTPSSVVITQDNYFFNCIYGTYTNRCATDIQGVTMDTVLTGVHIRNGVNTHSVVNSCTINAVYYGIDLFLNAGATGIDITGNTISVNKNATGTAGISMAENSKNNAFYFIAENNITIKGARDGIVANNVFNPVIVNNLIDQVAPTSSPNTNRGISLYASDSSIVSCNVINSTYSTSSAHATGIKVNISRDCDVACNSVFDQYYGFQWGGSCINSSFYGNIISKHYVGLYLNSSANIGVQPYHGNSWLDTTQYLSGYGAVNLNDSTQFTLGQSLFTTNQTIAAHNPKRPLNPGSAPFAGVDNGLWFVPFPSGNSISCSDSGICESFHLREGDDEMRMLIAKDSTLTSGFIPESKIIAKQQLYKELLYDSALAASDTVYQNFLDNQEFTSIGYLQEVTEAFKNSTVVENSLFSSIKTADSLCKVLSLELFQLESLITANPNFNYTSQRNDLIDDFISHQQDLQNLTNQQKSIDSLFIIEAEVKNNQANPSELPDENEKFINSIQIVYLQEGVSGINTWYSQILSIASQCPFAGGPAVYRARILVRELGYVVDYDDDYTCLQSGYYRQSSETPAENIPLGFTIVPNPANEYIEVILKESFEENCTLFINDALGRTVYQLNFSGMENNIRIPTTSLSPGVFQVSVSCNNQFSDIKKLSIVR